MFQSTVCFFQLGCFVEFSIFGFSNRPGFPVPGLAILSYPGPGPGQMLIYDPGPGPG